LFFTAIIQELGFFIKPAIVGAGQTLSSLSALLLTAASAAAVAAVPSLLHLTARISEASVTVAHAND